MVTHWAEITRTKDTDGDGLTDYDEVNKYNTNEHTNDTDRDGLNDYDEVVVYHADPFNRDTDGDYVSDGLEANVYHTDPVKMDTSGLGIDDFNAIYTYEVDSRNQTAVKELLQKIPNVKARNWNYYGDEVVIGSQRGALRGDGDVVYFDDEVIANISIRDPLIKWYAERSEIKWEPGVMSFAGVTIGRLSINGEDPCLGTLNIGEGPRWAQIPAYFLTHGRKGCCAESALTNLVILRLMDGGKYKAVEIGGTVGEIGHGWCEALIDGKVYVVDYVFVCPREIFYEKSPNINATTIYDSSIEGYRNYDPDWFAK